MGNPRGGSGGVSDYSGFKGYWDNVMNAFVFESQAERDRYLVSKYGYLRNGFRDPEDPQDERPPRRGSQFWTNESERLIYEAAVQKYPRNPGEGPMAYAARIGAAVTGAYKSAGQTMPRRGMSQREWREKAWQVKKAGGHAHFEEPVE